MKEYFRRSALSFATSNSRWSAPSNNRSTPLYWAQCLRSQALVQYCLHPEYCLNVEFHIVYDGDRENWDTEDTRRQITECRDFFSRLDHIAHYCCADSWRIATEKAREKEPSMKNIRRAASLGLHFSTSKLLPRCWSRGTLNVESERKSQKETPSASPDGHLQKSQIKSLKHLRAVPRVSLWKISLMLVVKCESSHTSRDNECRETRLQCLKGWDSFVNFLSKIYIRRFCRPYETRVSPVELWTLTLTGNYLDVNHACLCALLVRKKYF